MLLDRIHSMLSRKAHQVFLRESVRDAANGYGYNIVAECTVKIEDRYCQHCKYLEGRQDFCPVNGIHSFIIGFVDKWTGYGANIEEAVEMVVSKMQSSGDCP